MVQFTYTASSTQFRRGKCLSLQDFITWCEATEVGAQCKDLARVFDVMGRQLWCRYNTRRRWFASSPISYQLSWVLARKFHIPSPPPRREKFLARAIASGVSGASGVAGGGGRVRPARARARGTARRGRALAAASRQSRRPEGAAVLMAVSCSTTAPARLSSGVCRAARAPEAATRAAPVCP